MTNPQQQNPERALDSGVHLSPDDPLRREPLAHHCATARAACHHGDSRHSSAWAAVRVVHRGGPSDHSRNLLSCTAHAPVTGDDVVAVFLGLIEQYGPPAATLTDHGSVSTSRFTGGRNASEYVLALLGIQQKNGSLGHPQTQGKTERFHQTLQRWLAARPAARTRAGLQRQLEEFREHYNEQRPHRALDRHTPGQAYRATPKAAPPSNGHTPGHYRPAL